MDRHVPPLILLPPLRILTTKGELLVMFLSLMFLELYYNGREIKARPEGTELFTESHSSIKKMLYLSFVPNEDPKQLISFSPPFSSRNNPVK